MCGQQRQGRLADAARSAVTITWTSPLADTVELTTLSGSVPLGSTAADAPDQLVVPLNKFHSTYDPTLSSRIVVTDPSGAKAESVKFDQHIPRAVPIGVSVSAGMLQGSATVETSADRTPGDPLDVSVPLRYTPDLLIDCLRTRYATSSSPSFKVPVPGVPSILWIDTANEWPAPPVDENYAGFQLYRASVATTAPTSTTYRGVFTLSGVVYQLQEFYTPEQGNCGVERAAPDPRTVVIQARKDSKTAWTVVGSTKTTRIASLNGGPFSYQVTNPGTRQYRVVVPDRKTGNSIDFGVIGGPRTVKATTQVLSAKFLTPVVTYGKSAAAYLAVLPGANQRALTWKRRGITTFRWYTPTVMTSSGLTVGAAFTPTFHLTVR